MIRQSPETNREAIVVVVRVPLIDGISMPVSIAKKIAAKDPAAVIIPGLNTLPETPLGRSSRELIRATRKDLEDARAQWEPANRGIREVIFGTRPLQPKMNELERSEIKHLFDSTSAQETFSFAERGRQLLAKVRGLFFHSSNPGEKKTSIYAPKPGKMKQSRSHSV